MVSYSCRLRKHWSIISDCIKDQCLRKTPHIFSTDANNIAINFHGPTDIFCKSRHMLDFGVTVPYIIPYAGPNIQEYLQHVGNTPREVLLALLPCNGGGHHKVSSGVPHMPPPPADMLFYHLLQEHTKGKFYVVSYSTVQKDHLYFVSFSVQPTILVCLCKTVLVLSQHHSPAVTVCP